MTHTISTHSGYKFPPRLTRRSKNKGSRAPRGKAAKPQKKTPCGGRKAPKQGAAAAQPPATAPPAGEERREKGSAGGNRPGAAQAEAACPRAMERARRAATEPPQPRRSGRSDPAERGAAERQRGRAKRGKAQPRERRSREHRGGEEATGGAGGRAAPRRDGPAARGSRSDRCAKPRGDAQSARAGGELPARAPKRHTFCPEGNGGALAGRSPALRDAACC